jgi:hypothetical protein
MRKWVLILCALMWSAFLVPLSSAAQSSASIQIIKPVDRRNLALGEAEMIVEIRGVSLQDGYTWQPFLDGVPQGMVRNATTTKLMVDQPTGPRRIKAVLYDPNGVEIASNEILVLAAPVESQGEVFNRSWFVPVMAVFTLTLIGLIILGLRIRLSHAA